MIKKTIICSIVFLLTITSFIITVDANTLSYKVQPVLPENQDEDTTGHISINTNKESIKQEVDIMVSNITDQEITLNVEIVNALTSPQRVIQYTPNLKESNSILIDEEYSLKKYVSVEDSEIVLQGGESRNVTAMIDIPKLDGTILGAIRFHEKDSQKESVSDSFSINTKTSTTLGIQVNHKTEELPEITFDAAYLETMASYYAIRLPITFDSNLLLKDVDLEYDVLTKDGEVLFKTNNNPSFNVAPKSKVNVAIPWETENINDGEKYILKGILSYRGNDIHFEKEFEFNLKQDIKVKEANMLTVPNINDDNYSYLTVLIVGMLGIILMVIYFFWKRRKDTETKLEEEETRLNEKLTK